MMGQTSGSRTLTNIRLIFAAVGVGIVTRYFMRIFLGIIYLLFCLQAVPALAQTPTLNPDTILEDCNKTLRPDRPIPTGPDAPSIRIVSPISGTVARGPAVPVNDTTGVEVAFAVETKNFDLSSYTGNENSRHWHLWLNNVMWVMGYNSTATISIPVGTWRVCVSMGDENHADIGMPDGILLTVEEVDVSFVAPSNREPETTSFGTIHIILAVLGGFVALVGSWWLGSRVSKNDIKPQ